MKMIDEAETSQEGDEESETVAPVNLFLNKLAAVSNTDSDNSCLSNEQLAEDRIREKMMEGQQDWAQVRAKR